MTFGNRFPNVITEGLEVTTVREREDRVYVLNSVEFLEALLDGAFGLGYIPIRYDDRNLPAIRYVANGIIIEYMPPEEKVVEKEEEPPAPTVAPKSIESPTGITRQAISKSDAPERVQEVLKEVLDRVPRVNSIRNWSPEQRQEALEWVATVQKKIDGKSEDPIPPKPAFIVEPKRRERTKVDESPTVDTRHKRRGRQPVIEVISETYDPDKPKTVEVDLFPESKASDFFNQDLDEVAEDPTL